MAFVGGTNADDDWFEKQDFKKLRTVTVEEDGAGAGDPDIVVGDTITTKYATCNVRTGHL